jgi:hydrogenase maturation protein HypF
VTRAADRVRVRLHVEGIVQGVGFRPFVHGLACALDLTGTVGNDEQGVVAEIEGAPDAVEALVRAVRERPPALAVVETVRTTPIPTAGGSGVVIVDSVRSGDRRTLVSADTATCDDCLAELADPADRRHRYPFVNCTNCGPRFTIVRDVPYDRPLTTMAGFPMCDACAGEYHDPADRRFHAQPTCCPACGPTLRLDGSADDPVVRTAALLAEGAVVAVKGLGGYHLAVRADDESAVRRLRAAKHREEKAFALMAADLDAARGLVTLDDAAAGVLTSRRRPVVLLQRRPDAAVAAAVAPGNGDLGVMLPYTPVHHLLAAALGTPFVLTSGNVSDEPIAYDDADAVRRLRPLADAFLTHDRPIHVRTDDSVVRVHRGAELPVRRARGYAPEPVRLGLDLRRTVLGCGAELKNTVCLAQGRRAFLSSHIGDLTNAETYATFREQIEHLGRLFDLSPTIVAHDLHPEYLSTKYALERAEEDPSLELVGVQHHHAHIAACLAEHGWGTDEPPVLGVAFDGTGFGLDGTVWGGELLLATLAGFERVGHLATVPMPGGAAAIREPWRMAAAHLSVLADRSDRPGAVRDRHADRWDAVVSLARSGLSAPTSSVGRLFDAVSALAGAHGIGTAALSGGVFVNALLLERIRSGLEAAGLRVLVPSRAPCTDGGIALGQVAVAACSTEPAPATLRDQHERRTVAVPLRGVNSEPEL